MKLNPALITAIASMAFASLPAYAATSIPIPNGDPSGVWFDELSLSYNAIPEPSSAVLSACAFVGMVFLRRRQRA